MFLEIFSSVSYLAMASEIYIHSISKANIDVLSINFDIESILYLKCKFYS